MFRKPFWIVLCLLVVSIAGVAQAQDAPGEDPLITAAREAGLLHELNLTQTLDDISVTLNWAYVDTQQLILNYTVTGADPLMLNASFAITPIVLRDAEGYQFSYSRAMPLPDATADSTTVTAHFYNQAIRQIAGSDQYEVVDDYFHTHFDRVPAEIALQMALTLGGYEVPEWVITEGVESAYSVGDDVPAVGPFTFDFTVPVTNSVELEPMETVEADGLAVTLEALSVAPTAAEARICYDMPDGRDWLPEATLTIDGEIGYMSGHGVTDMAQFENTERRCRNVSFSAFYDGSPTTLTLSLDYLSTSMQEGPADWERIEEVLAEDGIDIDVIFERGESGGGMRIEEVDVPEGFDLQEALNAARETLGDRVAGPWVFEVELP